ncbi:MAG: hypothetical protein NC342_00060 [Pseudoflavonifractor sp.]|nr:hypothetical protein [Alloprevotella sp.]MCM1115921.1 hypothetical protein [Pseudoflavonifractor sp.]
MIKPFSLKTLLAPLLLIGLLVPTLTSCDDNDDPNNVVIPTVMNIVTLKRYLPEGGMEFTFRTGAATPLVTLTTPLRIDTSVVKMGQRVLIGYNIPDNRPDSVSGPIDLISARKVFNDTIMPATQKVVESYAVAPVGQLQAWRTGNFINAMGLVPYYGTVPNLVMYADEASISGDAIDMYITLNDPDTPPAQRIDTYSSFDIRRFIATHSDIHTFRIYYPGCQGEPLIISGIYPLHE